MLQRLFISRQRFGKFGLIQPINSAVRFCRKDTGNMASIASSSADDKFNLITRNLQVRTWHCILNFNIKIFWSLKLILPLSCETFVLYFRCNWHGRSLNFYLLISLNGSVKLCTLFAGLSVVHFNVLKCYATWLICHLRNCSDFQLYFRTLEASHGHRFCCLYQIVLILTRCIYIAQ